MAEPQPYTPSPDPITCSEAPEEEKDAETARSDRETSSLTLLLMAVHASNARG